VTSCGVGNRPTVVEAVNGGESVSSSCDLEGDDGAAVDDVETGIADDDA